MRNWLATERRVVADQLKQELSAFGCVALLGEFRMGKTLALQSLRDVLPPPRVYISLAESASEHAANSDERFYLQVLQGLAQDWGDEPPAGVPLAPPDREMDAWDRYKWFESALEQLARRPLIILLDDAERLADVPWGEQFFRKLPGLMSRENNVCVVLAGTRRLERWAEDLRHSTGRAGLWNLIRTPIILGSVSLQTVRDTFLDKQPLAQRLIELCGGHPYCLHQLTKDLQLQNRSPSRLVREIKDKVGQLEMKWDGTFRCYWQAYDCLTRQVCFLLTVTPEGLKPQELRSKLGRVSEAEFKHAVEAMANTGILFEDTESESVRLIELFRQWYGNEVGFVEDVWADQVPGPSPRPSPVKKEVPTTELTFFPDEDLVLIRRDRFLSLSKLVISRDRLFTDIPVKTRRVPTSDEKRFAENLRMLGRDLWAELHSVPWFEEVIDGVDAHHRLRFNIPIEMGEFPFELLPLDETGTRRVGMQVPISRQLFKQGRYVERAPLALPREDETRLRVLVVAAEMGGEISIDADGRVHRGMDAQIVDGEFFRLAQLRLDQEVRALHQLLTSRSDLIEEVMFLTHSRQVYNTVERGVNIHCDLPTAEVFQAVLKDPDKQFDVLHFVGHGLFAPDAPMMGGLLFEDQLVHLTELKGLLKAQSQLCFIYLSCCESGILGSDERTSDLLGLAHACVEAGVPAVLAMRWRIPVGASCRLTEAFYPAFFEKGALDQALHTAAQQVYEQERNLAKKVYASAPVLIMH
jgi:hypothetical protein